MRRRTDRLPFTNLFLVFDPVRLAVDLAQIEPAAWIRHYNTQDYDGGWSGVALRSAGGATARLYANPATAEPFADTPLLSICPYFREVLATFTCPLRAVRLLRLEPGAFIREHRDPDLGLEYGEARIHVPITTNPDVVFVVNARKLVMQPGEAWYVDFSLPHRVANRGQTDRVHLVIDCTANDWLRALMAQHAAAEPDELPGGPDIPRSEENLERFRQRVLDDPSLQEELGEILDRELFVAHAVHLGEERGFGFTAEQVEDALRTAQRAWILRNVQ